MFPFKTSIFLFIRKFLKIKMFQCIFISWNQIYFITCMHCLWPTDSSFVTRWLVKVDDKVAQESWWNSVIIECKKILFVCKSTGYIFRLQNTTFHLSVPIPLLPSRCKKYCWKRIKVEKVMKLKCFVVNLFYNFK